MEDVRRCLDEAVAAWDRRGWPRPAAAVVAGSGLAVDLGAPVHGPIGLRELLPFTVHPVEGHPHRVELVEPRAGRPVLYFRGRLHSYQGYDADQTVFTVRLAGRLGASTLLLTNAAGGLRPDHRPGRLMLVKDHMNLTGLNPLRGRLPAEWGPQFVEMVAAYDEELRRLARRRAEALGIGIEEGIYAGLAGPSYETPAEAAMLRSLGADAVGMSTVLEVIAARHLGLRCLGLSLITNVSATAGADHEEVLAAGRAAATDVQRLLAAMLEDDETYRLSSSHRPE